jgi:predicted metal-dependent peptidase
MTKKTADQHGVNVEETKKPVTTADINAARDALSITTSLLLSPYIEGHGAMGKAGDKTFYANFLMRMNVEFGNRIPTAGVSITDKINFYINPHFFLSLGVPGCEEMQELVIHEVEHIVYLHPLRSKKLLEGSDNKGNDHKLYNIAADANINIPLKALTQNLGVTIERLNEQLKEHGSTNLLCAQDASDVHYWKLKEFQEEMGDKLPQGFGEGEGGECDDHSTWDESNGSEEIGKAIVREATNKAAQATGVGNCPSHIVSQMGELNKSVVNWKRELQQFAVRTMKFAQEQTRTRRNRRFGILQQGKRKQPKVKIVVIGDESGSMSDKAVNQIFSEIDKIHSLGVEIVYIAMDTEVSQVVEYKKGMKMTRTACGGTYYTSGINKAKELKPDAIILIGDGDSADQPTNPKIPFLWVIVGDQKAPGDFGRTIHVDVDRK